MPRTEPAQPSSVAGEYRTEVAMPMHGVDPAALLRLGQGGPRGFWAREGRWIAHIGQVAVARFPSRQLPSRRFAGVWSAAEEILRDTVPDPGSELDPPSPRFFGGFAFREDHQPVGSWEGFPAAHFVLPEIELVGGREGGTLTLRGRRSRPAGGGRDRAGLRTELGRLAERLTSQPPLRMPPAESPTTAFELDSSLWKSMVERALKEIHQGRLSKVVMARALTASFTHAPDPVAVVLSLWKGNPGAYVFFFEPIPGHVLVGAAPETLATVSEGTFRATAVAGSIGTEGDPGRQTALARELLASEKDRREHRVCVEDMTARLARISRDIRAESEPHVLTLTSIQHLETAITARLAEGETVLSALEALHPTPAVCGFPRDQAQALLQKLESFQRGWYAGPVGWFDGQGDGVFVPALRSAVGRDREWKLFSGAGIVAGSDPAKEWEETRMKFRPVMEALTGEQGAMGTDFGVGG